MVAYRKQSFPLFILAVLLLFNACDADVLGFFGSTDLDERLGERNSFKLLSPADRSISLGSTYSFIVLSDTHIEDGDAHGFEKLKAVIDGEIKFVVVTGDISDSGKRKDILRFIEIARSLGVPCYPVIGNHDIFFGNWKVWKELIGSTSYRIDGRGATLFILDSANVWLGADQLSWLERELKSAQGRVFVFTHVNVFGDTLLEIDQFTDERERARLVSLLKGRCDAMFMGHVHKRIIKELQGVRYITLEDHRSTAVYCLVSVSPDGISWEFRKL